MAYPKRQSSINGSMNGSQAGFSPASYKEVKATKRREQLHMLLVNKFRGKYQIDMDEENPMDRVITAEVARLLETESMTEVNLVKLDKRIGELLMRTSKSQHSSMRKTPAIMQGLNSAKGEKAGSVYQTLDSRGSNRLVAGA